MQQRPSAAQAFRQAPQMAPVTWEAPEPSGHGGADMLLCPHSGQACPSLTRLFAGKEYEDTAEARSWIARITPCGSCRTQFECGRAKLRGLRLGQRERDVLIGASRQEAFPVTEAGMTRSVSAARRRAAQSLAKAGLVSHGRGARGRATVSLTPLGVYVLKAYGRFIETGKPVRWDRPSSKVPLPGRPAGELLDEAVSLTQAAMHETLSELKKVLIRAVGRPVKDPGLLDKVTRQLEAKARGLRSLLEPTSA